MAVQVLRIRFSIRNKKDTRKNLAPFILQFLSKLHHKYFAL